MRAVQSDRMAMARLGRSLDATRRRPCQMSETPHNAADSPRLRLRDRFIILFRALHCRDEPRTKNRDQLGHCLTDHGTALEDYGTIK